MTILSNWIVGFLSGWIDWIRHIPKWLLLGVAGWFAALPLRTGNACVLGLSNPADNQSHDDKRSDVTASSPTRKQWRTTIRGKIMNVWCQFTGFRNEIHHFSIVMMENRDNVCNAAVRLLLERQMLLVVLIVGNVGRFHTNMLQQMEMMMMIRVPDQTTRFHRW